jgi:hypothetical protein
MLAILLSPRMLQGALRIEHMSLSIADQKQRQRLSKYLPRHQRPKVLLDFSGKRAAGYRAAVTVILVTV